MPPHATAGHDSEWTNKPAIDCSKRASESPADASSLWCAFTNDAEQVIETGVRKQSMDGHLRS